MAVRVGMAAIIATLRQYGQAAPDDEFDGVIYWTDAQLQQIADQNGTREYVKAIAVDLDNTIFRLILPKSKTIENDLKVYNLYGVEVVTPFTFNSDTGELTFTTALTDTEYRGYGLVIQIYDALAQLWQVKADQRFNYIDWKAQNNRMNMAQEYQHCVERAIYYRNKRVRTFDRKGRGEWYR